MMDPGSGTFYKITGLRKSRIIFICWSCQGNIYTAHNKKKIGTTQLLFLNNAVLREFGVTFYKY